MSPDDIFAKKITAYLDHGVADLKSGTAYRLQLARAEALARLADPVRATEAQTVIRASVAGAGSGTLAASVGPGAASRVAFATTDGVIGGGAGSGLGSATAGSLPKTLALADGGSAATKGSAVRS